MVDLTPRTAPDPSAPSRSTRHRSPWAYAVLVVVLVGVGVVAYQALNTASLYFYNADEAVAQRDQLGDKRIRVQGVVQTEAEPGADGVAFVIAFNDEEINVVHDGEPPELFAVGTPVLLEGAWSTGSGPFMSDEIFVKHDEQYEADNGDRIADAEDGQSDDSAEP